MTRRRTRIRFNRLQNSHSTTPPPQKIHRYVFSFFLSGKDPPKTRETKSKDETKLIHNDMEGSLPSVRSVVVLEPYLRECLDIWIEKNVQLRRETQRKIACETICRVSKKIFHRIRLEALNKWRLSARMNTEIAKHRGRLMRRLLQKKAREVMRLYVSRWYVVFCVRVRSARIFIVSLTLHITRKSLRDHYQHSHTGTLLSM